MKKERQHHSCAVITTSSSSGNVVLVCGGYDRSECEIYNPVTNSWANGPSLDWLIGPELVGSAMVAASTNSTYDAFILGGYTKEGWSNKIIGVKDLTTVTLVGTLEKGRGFHVAIKTHALVASGC